MAEKKVKKTTSKKPVKVVKKSSKKVKAVKETSIVEHSLVPLHEKLSLKEVEEVFVYHNITIKELPKILKNDPAIRHLDAKENDVIKITRKSETAGDAVFYRGVINE